MEIEDDLISLKLPDATQEESIIKVIGVGGGGSNAVNHMFRQGIHGVEFVVCNTDIQALRQSRVKNRIQLGKELTEGRGAGCQPERGRLSAIESMDFIKTILEHNTRMVFITAGMGGGTGTGAAPEIARQAKESWIFRSFCKASRAWATRGIWCCTAPMKRERSAKARRFCARAAMTACA